MPKYWFYVLFGYLSFALAMSYLVALAITHYRKTQQKLSDWYSMHE